jgi:hypothetical protein
MNVVGTVIKVLPVEQIKEYRKQIVVLETHEDYPKKVAIEFFGKQQPLAEKCEVGKTVDVSINLESREWEKDGKVSFFTTAKAWRLNFGAPPAPVRHAPPAPPAPTAPPRALYTPPAPPAPLPPTTINPEDLPF